MYDIELYQATEEYARCWDAAGRHLQATAKDVSISWLKADLTPPILEHISFRIANQLFFIRIEDAIGRLNTPGNPDGLLSIADGCNGNACLMPMKRTGNKWVPVADGWGLIDARSRTPIDPVMLVTDEKIDMTDWELHDFAVQIVRNHITEELGYKLMSYTGRPGVEPSIWFLGASGPEWAVVRAVRYPSLEALLPGNVEEIAESCARMSRSGHFASVSAANSDDSFDPENVPALPLWRGHKLKVRFTGLAPIVLQ